MTEAFYKSAFSLCILADSAGCPHRRQRNLTAALHGLVGAGRGLHHDLVRRVHAAGRVLGRAEPTAGLIGRQQMRGGALVVGRLVLLVADDVRAAAGLAAGLLRQHLLRMSLLHLVTLRLEFLIVHRLHVLAVLLRGAGNVQLPALPYRWHWLGLRLKQVQSATGVLCKKNISVRCGHLRETKGTAFSFSHHSSVTTTFWAGSVSCAAEWRCRCACVMSRWT